MVNVFKILIESNVFLIYHCTIIIDIDISNKRIVEFLGWNKNRHN